MFGSAESEHSRLTNSEKLFLKDSNLCDQICELYIRTDRETDGQTDDMQSHDRALH